MPIFSRSVKLLHNNSQNVTFGSTRNFTLSSQALTWSHLVSKFGSIRSTFVNNSILLMKNTILQAESLGAQKLRRLHNIGSLYCNIYERNQLLELLRSLARKCKNPKYMLGGAILSNSSGCDWKKERLSNSEIAKYYKDIDDCAEIRQNPDGCDWKPFLERGDIIVWRKEHAVLKGMYEYKMYGNFDDVTADEFLSVQLDMSEFRLSWDKSTAQCNVLDKDVDTGAVVYYWEVNWPRFFSNRDYCCYREHSVDPATGTMLVSSRSIEHSACPSKRKVWRVQDYESVLTIRPHTTSDKPGIEFCLTGFENPGVQLPETIITWVAMRGMPEFMMNLREACLKLRKDQELQSVKVNTSHVKEEEAAKQSYQESYQGQRPIYA